MTTERKYYIPAPDYIDGEPFKNDLFERKILAERLTKYIDGLSVGCVIGLDAPWGEGKTYFARNWQIQLNEQGYKTIYLDAFEQDYTDDPFLLITSEILSAIKQEEDESWVGLRDACISVGKVLVPSAAKFAVNTLGKMFLGINELSEVKERVEELFEEKLGDATEKYIQKRLQSYDEEKQTTKHFKEVLAKFSKDQGEKPVVFFIDELDRCRPSFAVQVIERIKHFFDTPNLVFVLLLNRRQLEESIRGVYGATIDAHAYLGKFVHFFLSLPKNTTTESSSGNHNRVYVTELSKRYNYPHSRDYIEFLDTVSIFATLWRLSLRDLEKLFIYFTIGQPISSSARLVAYLLCLKLYDSGKFIALARGDLKTHKLLLDELNNFNIQANSEHIAAMIIVHKAVLDGYDVLNDEEKGVLHCSLDGHYSNAQRGITTMIKKLDTVLVD